MCITACIELPHGLYILPSDDCYVMFSTLFCRAYKNSFGISRSNKNHREISLPMNNEIDKNPFLHNMFS